MKLRKGFCRRRKDGGKEYERKIVKTNERRKWKGRRWKKTGDNEGRITYGRREGRSGNARRKKGRRIEIGEAEMY